MEIRVGETRRRGHAADMARQAARDGLDVVVALGGDGTVNEVVNGLLTATPNGRFVPGGRHEPARVPALAVVPGGSTNVFARALGLPGDAIEATGALLESIHTNRTRTVGLGRADGRYFTFCAGFGLDAEVVRKVERARLRGKTSTPALYIRSTLTQFLLDTKRRVRPITLERGGEEPERDLATVIVQNTAPWTYLGGRPINPCPDADFDSGLDLMALRGLHLTSTTLVATNLLTGRRPSPHSKQSFILHDLSDFTLSCAEPLAFQLDGDYLGERTKVSFSAVPDALRVYS
jgi:diacylglycerol kinase family enzyme